MFLIKKYFCVLDDNFIIKNISPELAVILGYENSEEILNRHLAIIFPKYFLFLNHGTDFKNSKTTALFLSKSGESVPVFIKLFKKESGIHLKVKIKKSQALEVLANYQTFFNNINQAATFGIIIFNDKGYVVHVNDAICRMYGYSFHEIIGLHGTAFIHPKIHYEFYRLINDVKSGEEFSVKSLEIRKDGSLFNSFVEGKAVYTKFGKFLTALVFDVTDTVEKEEELKFQKAIFKNVFDLSPVGYFIYDENLIVTESNKAFLEQLEIRREDFIGFDINRITNKAPFNLIKKSLSGEKCLYNGYYTSLLSGKTIYSKALFIPIKYKDKNWGIGISLDLTKEKQIENDLIQKKQFYESLINTALTGIGITDVNENFILVNPAFAHMVGYTVDEMMNTPLSNYTTPRQMALFKKQTEIRKQGNPSVYEASLVNKKGNLMHVLIHASPMKNDTGEVIGTLGIVIDLTYQDFLTKQITTLTEKNESLLKEVQEQLQSVFSHLKMTVPMLLEISHAVFDKKITDEQKQPLIDSLDKYLFILSNTYQQVEILSQCQKANYKIRNKKRSLSEFNYNLQTFFKQKSEQKHTISSIYFEKQDGNKLIEIAEDAIFKAFEFIINNIIIRHNTHYIYVTQLIKKNKISFVIKAKAMESNDFVVLRYFNPTTLCFQVSSKLVNLQKGTMECIDDKVLVEIPLVFSLPESNKEIPKFDYKNIYTTKIWSNFSLLIISENITLKTLTKQLLSPTEMKVVIAPCGSAFIPFIMHANYTDIIMIDDNLANKDGIDYQSLCQRFLPNVPIVGVVQGNQILENSYDGVILQDKNFQEELFMNLSKFLEYGKPN